MTDTIDRPVVLDLDLDDVRERPVVTRRPIRPPAAPLPLLSSTVRYPPGPVPDVQDRTAVEVPAPRPVVRRTWTRSRVVAGLLGVFLGGLGLHRMYLGYWRRGFAMLAITVIGGFFTLGLAALAMGVCGFVEGLLYLSARRGRFARDARGLPLRG